MNARFDSRPPRRGVWLLAGATCAFVMLADKAVVPSALIAAQEPQAPSPLRSGTIIIRIDATVIDRRDDPVGSLNADDFEVREDGCVQPISSFKFISADGQPSNDRSLPIRRQQHAAAEAARDANRGSVIGDQGSGIGDR